MRGSRSHVSTLLHVAAEYGHPAAVALLLDRRADINARATVDDAGVGGQTAVFHAVTQFDDGGLPVTQLLVERGADLAVRVKLRGDYDRPGEIVECTALGYALRFGGPPQRKTVTLLRERGAIE
jgi:ankyrin repeat protein